jgi:hypothetical protein
MAGFIALCVFLSTIVFCHGMVCIAAQADTVFAGLNYAVWIASTTILGIEILKFGVKVRGAGSISEKMIEQPSGQD